MKQTTIKQGSKHNIKIAIIEQEGLIYGRYVLAVIKDGKQSVMTASNSLDGIMYSYEGARDWYRFNEDTAIA